MSNPLHIYCALHLVEKLCQEFRIITIDPRGDGASDPLPERYTLRDHAADVRAVIEASAAGHVVGLGVSRGGTLMVTLAAAYPGLVHQLVLISSHATPSVTHARLEWVDEVRVLLRHGQKEQAFRILASTIYSEPGTDHLIDQTVQSHLNFPTDIALNFLTPDPEDDVDSLLPDLQVPTLVMHGTVDRRVPFAAGQYLAEHIAGAQFYAFEGKGHMAMFTTAVNEFCEVLRHFVRTGGVPER
jgi:pimeloyl-ACP methyl ester carboxylesterase